VKCDARSRDPSSARAHLADSVHRPVRSALRQPREAAAAVEPGRDVLPDGRVGLDGRQRKDLAKRFFILLYLFLKRNYERSRWCIRHHTRAEEVDEDTFFHSTESGGTVVSSALELMVIDERYADRVEHLRRAGLGRRQLDRRFAEVPQVAREDILPKCVFRLHPGRAGRAESLAGVCATGAVAAALAMKKVERLPTSTRYFAMFEKQVEMS
jgi:hypothetical protein